MKKITLTLAVAFALFMTSCGNDDDGTTSTNPGTTGPTTSQLIVNTWDGIDFRTKITFEGTVVADDLADLSGQQYIFKSDGTAEFTNGASINTGTWSLLNGSSQIIIENHNSNALDTFDIDVINTTQFNYSKVETNAGPFGTTVFETTYRFDR